jgi:flagellar motor switch protein FliM
VTAPEDEPRELFGAATEGPLKRAITQFDRHASAMAGAIRRSVPFLVRCGVAVTPDPAAPTTAAALEAEIAAPTFVITIATEPGHVRGQLIFGAEAVSYLLDGLLGGDGSAPPQLSPEGLTGPQRVLLGRIADGVVQALSASCDAVAGFRLIKVAVAMDEIDDGALLAVSFRLGADGESGRIVLALGKDALLGGITPKPRGVGLDPRVAAALGAVEIELVAELGQVRMKLGDLAALRVGHVLATTVPVGGTIRLRTGSRVLHHGYPTTSGGQVAIRIGNGTTLEEVAVDTAKEISNHE